MDMKEILAKAVKVAVAEAMAAGALPKVETDLQNVIFTEPPNKELGDFATNFALQSAKLFRLNPRIVAREIANRLKCERLDHVEVAGAGFINFYLNDAALADTMKNIFAAGENWGNHPPKDAPKILVEYVSANPTGPLHVGHGRGAAAGSALVNIFRAAGFPTASEFYINDAGNQMENLALSVNSRYLELLGKETTFPENGYHGVDIIETAKKIVAEHGDKFLSMEEGERLKALGEIAYKEKLALLKSDLEDFRVTFDRWFSERTLHESGAVDAAVQALVDKGEIYEDGGAKWFRSTDYGDDKDRVVVRDNGIKTYLAADIAYHKDKYERGFDNMINIWGADHHGYVSRVKGAMTALGFDASKLQIMLLQMVSLYRGGEPVKMSKRTGQSVTLAELMEEVGTDAARYFFLMRSLDSQLDFDIDLATKKSNDNPVYYIQYAHARIKSIFKSAAEAGMELPADEENIDFSLLTDETETDLIKKLSTYPEEVEKAAAERAPQRIARYAYDLSGMFHSFYNKCRVIGIEENLAKARLAMAQSAANTIKHALGLLGVSAPDKM